nr:putative holin [Chromobacterium sphagni]
MLSSDSLGLAKRAMFFIASFIAGCLAAASVAGLLAKWMPIEASPGVGALIAAALPSRCVPDPPGRRPGKALRTLKGGGQ